MPLAKTPQIVIPHEARREASFANGMPSCVERMAYGTVADASMTACTSASPHPLPFVSATNYPRR